MHGRCPSFRCSPFGTHQHVLTRLQRRRVCRSCNPLSSSIDPLVDTTPAGTMSLLQHTLGNDLRLLEAAALFDAADGPSSNVSAATVGSPKQLLIQVLRCLKGNPDKAQLDKAQRLYTQLASELSCHPDSSQLEPLRTYLHLKLWGGDSYQRKELQSYLIKELNLNFEALAEDEPKASSAASARAGSSGSSYDQPLPTLPTQISPEQYSSSAVATAHKDQMQHDSWPLARYLGPHQLLPALLDSKTWPIASRWALLASNAVPVAAVPVEGLVGLLTELIGSSSSSRGTVEVAAALRQAVEAWADGQWPSMTAGQVRAVHDLLTQQPLPSGGYASGNRNALAALAFKALTEAPAVSLVTPGVTPQQAEVTVKEQQLAAVLRLCDNLGAPADWIRVHVVRAQLLLAAKQDPAAVPLKLLATYLQLLGRCQWSYSSSGTRVTPVPATGSSGPWPGARSASSCSSSQAHPSHVRCQVCYQQPLVGVRFRSKRQLGVSMCKGCVGKAAARDAGPYEEVAEDDTIYLYPTVELPAVLGALPYGYEAAWQEAAKVLGTLAAADGGKRYTPKVNPLVEDYGVAVEPRLYWTTVSEAMLTSLTKAQELSPWAEVYQAWGGDIQALRSSSELAFSDGNAVQYGVEEDVVLQLSAKNVGPQGLVVKAHHLNAWGYHLGENKELGVDLALEGVGPTTERHIPLPEDSLQRHLLRVPLGLAGQAGVVLVDVVAGARSCRCLIHKGQLVLSSCCNAAGQVLTVLYPDRSPAKAARIWCDGKEYAADPATGAVLLPYVRNTRTTSLVLAAPARGSAGEISGSVDEIVAFIPQYKRLAEFYKLAASISGPQEALLPRTTAQLQVRVGLGLHGEPAPLALLEGASLQLTTTTSDGTEVQQVVEDLDWGPNPYQGCMMVPLPVPERVSQVTALLRCRVKLVSPGVNGDPEYQNFEETKRWDVNAMDAQRSVWDLQLTRIPFADQDPPSSSSSSSATKGASSVIAGLFKRGPAAMAKAAAGGDDAGGEYALRVVGKAGEVPVVPATIQLDVYHQEWGEGTGLRFKLQTDSQGCVRLGSLSGIRSIKAQFIAPPGTAAAGDVVEVEDGSVAGLQLKQQEALFDDASTAMRTWQLLGDQNVQPLQILYNVAQGSVLEVPYDPAALSGEHVKPLLLQLAPPTGPTSANPHAASLEGAQRQVLRGLPVAADVTAGHLRASPGDISGTLVINDLKVGYYMLLLPVHPGRAAGSSAGLAKVDIVVMPSAAAAAAAVTAEGGDGNKPQVEWQVPGREGAEVLLVPSSQAQPLSITSASCSPSEGLTVELRGSEAQLEAAQVSVVFVRHIPDTTIEAAVRPAAATQQYGSPEGSEGPAQGWDIPLLPASGSSCCSYTDSVRVDSAVAYVMQRRQWRAANSLRAGMLLERPSLLVHPRKVRNVAAATTVLRGGDGEQYTAKKMAGSQPRPMAAPCMAAPASCYGSALAYGESASMMDEQCREEAGYGIAGKKKCRPQAKRRVASSPVSPTLSYLQPAGLLLSQLAVDPATGRLHLPPQQLQQLCGGLDLAAAGYTAVYVQALDASQGSAALGKYPAAACRVAVQLQLPQPQQQQAPSVRDLGLMRPLTDQGVCAQVLRVVSLSHPGSDLLVSNAGAASLNLYVALPKAVKLMGLLLDRHDVLTPPPVPGVSEAGSAAALWQAQWAGPLSRWASLGTREQQEAVARLGSCEWSLFLAAKDPAAFHKLVLPLLRFKLSASLTMLEGLLLLQAAHQQPPLPHPAAPAVSGPGAAAYKSDRASFLDHWTAAHRYAKLNACERVFLAALEGQAACVRLAADMRQQLEAQEAAQQDRDIRKGPAPPLTWLHKERRWQFELALACGQSDTDHIQEEGEERTGDSSDGTADADDEDYDMLLAEEAVEGAAFGGGGPSGAMPPPAPPPPTGAAAPMAARCRAAAAPAPGGSGPQLARMQVAQAQGVMAARAAVASDGARRAALAPKEVCEWAEAGWWRYHGTSPPVDLIPLSHFWAAYADHLATSTSPAAPFLPEHLTSAAASTAAAVCALAVLGLPFKPSAAAPAAGGAGGGGKTSVAAVQCSYQGASMTLTANSPCLLYLKCIEEVLGSTTDSSSSGAVAPASSSSTVNSSVLVVQQLFDPQQPDALDPETGEKVLQQVDPAVQKLLVGRVYGLRCVVTSMSASEQQLELLLQVPQGALPLEGAPAVQPLALTLQPYSSHQQQLYFYFPHAGSYPQVSPSLTKRGKPAWVPLAALPAVTVVPHLAPGAQASGPPAAFDWDAFHRRASNKQLLEWLKDGNLELVTLSDVNGRCKDAGFFKKLADLLTQRKVFDQSIMRWGIYHMHEASLRQYLPGCRLLQYLRVPLVTPVTSVVPSDVGQRHLEYWPWVNPYSRPLPGTAQPDIPSVLYDIPAIREQYQTFLLALLLSPQKALDAGQAAAAATYLLLQDRVDEAERVLGPHLGAVLGGGAAGGDLGTPAAMQVAYLGAWLALCPRLPWGPQQQAAAMQTVRAALERYGGCSEPVWSKRWAALGTMVDDLTSATQAAAGTAPTGRPPAASGAAADGLDAVDVSSEPLLTVLGLSGSLLKLKARALPTIKVAAYEVDVELLFTRQPFGGLLGPSTTSSSSSNTTASASSNSSSLRSLAYLRPRAAVTVPLGAGHDAAALPAGVHVPTAAGSSGGGVMDLELDLDLLFPQLTAAALLLELQAGSITRSVPRTSSRLVAHALEAVGQVQVLAPASAGGAGAAGGQGVQQLLPAPGAYIKVFVRDTTSGEEWFHKDGYTDLRGRFDYHTLTSAGSGNNNKQLRYSLLVLVEGEGSLVLEAAAPPRL